MFHHGLGRFHQIESGASAGAPRRVYGLGVEVIEDGLRRRELDRSCTGLFAACDLLLTPAVPADPSPAEEPSPQETEGRPQPLAGVASFTLPFNLSWHPAPALPCGRSRAGPPAGAAAEDVR